MTDQIIDVAKAIEIQAKAAVAHVRFAWIILHDCSGSFLARFATTYPTIYILEADTLAELRTMLPPCLVCSERQPADPPEVVEIWFSA